MSDATPETTMGERTDDSRISLWILLTGNRTLLAAALTVGLFVILAVVGATDTLSLRVAIHEGTHVERLFQALIMSLITGITLVVTLNQLVLSRELGPLGEQRSNMADSIDFRRNVEELTGEVPSPEPASFMQLLVGSTRERVESLQAATEGNDTRDLREDVGGLADRIRAHAEEVESQLSGAEFGRFEVVPAVLNYNYAMKVYETHRLRSEYADSLDADERAAFDDLLQSLSLFGPAREHFKTLYFRRELVDFSRKMLYTGVPALAVSILGLLYIDPNSFPGTTFQTGNLVFVVTAAVAVSTTPFFLLVAYILRLGTIAKRTLAIGPFVLRDSQRPEGENEDGWGEQ